jgi:tetratricopeptide (TPR) repeat protein
MLAACGDPGGEAIRRGDRLLAEGRTEAAIAEYRLARRQAGETPRVLLRLGHAYAAAGDVDESLRHFHALLAQDSSHLPQVAMDLAAAARGARERGARETMARALQPLGGPRLGLIPVDLRLSLARYHWEDGEYARALPLYLSVLADTARATPPALYETARAYEELGGCTESLEYFEAYLRRAGRDAGERNAARWHLGSCLFAAAEADREGGHPRAALRKLDRMIELGVPQTLLDRAHFLRGELLLALGDRDEALASYRQVLRLNPTRSGLLVRRAEDRIRDILYDFR